MCAIKRKNRGAALLLALMITIAVGLLAAALTMGYQEQVPFSRVVNIRMDNITTAQGGAELGRAALRSATSSVVTTINGDPTAVVYLVNYDNGGSLGDPTSSSDPYFDSSYSSVTDPFTGQAGASPGYSSSKTSIVAASSIAADLSQFKWVRISLETELRVGQAVTANSSLENTVLDYSPFYGRFPQGTTGVTGVPVYLVVARSVEGGNQRTTMIEAAQPSLGLDLPSAMTMLGNNPVYLSPDSNGWSICGADAGSPQQPMLPAIGVQGPNSVTYVENNIKAQRLDSTHYTGSSTPGGTSNATSCKDGTVAEAAPPSTPRIELARLLRRNANGLGHLLNVGFQSSSTTSTSPAIIDINSYLNTNFNTVSGLKQIVTDMSSIADNVYTSSTAPTAGPAAGDITVVQGDYALTKSNYSGSGILVVTGTLSIGSNFSWNGLIMVIGTGSIQYVNNGGGSPNINGALLFGNVCGNTSSPAADLSNCTTMGTSSFANFSGGGNGDIQYNSSDINDVYQNHSYLELSYSETTD